MRVSKADRSDPSREDAAPTGERGRRSGHARGAVVGWRRRVAALVPGLAVVAVIVGTAFGIHGLVGSVSPLVLSVVLGALAAGWWPPRAEAGARFAATTVLRGGVVLLGLQLPVAQVAALGWSGMVLVVSTVAVTFVGIQLMGRWLGLTPALSLLVAVGYSICGASAIAAAESATRAKEEEVAYALALVTLCGTLSIAVLPPLGHAVGLSAPAFGMWTGAAVHDVAQVVATSSVWGAAAVEAAVLTKLSRVVLLAPMIVLLSLAHRRREGGGGRVVGRPPLVPLFVVGFLVAVGLRSSGVVPAVVLSAAEALQTVLLAAALAGLGAGVRWRTLRSVGGRPLVLGLLGWLLVAGFSLIGVGLLPP